jgi:hypothetical protein
MANWQQAFSVINTALGVISAAGNTPGVNLIPYVSTVASAAAAIQTGLNAAVNVAPYVEAISDTFSGGLPSASQLSALDAKIAELEAKVDAPLPPKEDGEED